MVAFFGERRKKFETKDAALPMSFLFPCRGGAAGASGCCLIFVLANYS